MTRVREKREREKQIIKEMITLYCRGNHGSEKGARCPDCEALLLYAWQRSEKCHFIEEKNFCSNCKIHCYRLDMRENIRKVMRWSGPRMIFHRPVMVIRHMIESMRERKRPGKRNAD